MHTYTIPIYCTRTIIKAIVHQFWIYNIFLCPNRKIFFIKGPPRKNNNSDSKQLRKMVPKVSPCYIYNIYKSTRSDWLWAPYFLNYFESELFLSRWTFYKKCFFCWDTKEMLYIQNWWTIPSKVFFCISFYWND